ncbi:MAG: hypothetical protein JWL63_765 [Rhodocyclales bacterium]|nr:hypothetical protein [Rhodocyclales bacterium]
MRRTRLVLEHKGLKGRYPTISLYCDWLQHTEIDRNPSVWSLIEKIDGIFTSVPGGTVEEDMATISGAFSLTPLRHELIALYKAETINTSLFTVLSNWRQFILHVLADLAQRPLRFPNPPPSKAAREVLERIVARRISRGKNPDHRVTSVFISDRRSEESVPGRPPGFYFHIRMRETSETIYAELNGPLLNGESRADFEAD